MISDVRMSYANGYELLTTVRANPALDAVRSILLASYSDDDNAADRAVAMADACLSKTLYPRTAVENSARTDRLSGDTNDTKPHRYDQQIGNVWIYGLMGTAFPCRPRLQPNLPVFARSV